MKFFKSLFALVLVKVAQQLYGFYDLVNKVIVNQLAFPKTIQRVFLHNGPCFVDFAARKGIWDP